MRRATGYLGVAVIAGALGQLLMKVGVSLAPPLAALSFTLEAVPVLAVIWVSAGIACYGLAVCVWVEVLKVYPLSIAYPVLSLGYIIVYIVSISYLGESGSLQKSCGIGLIILGVALVAHTPQEGSKHE